MPFLAVREHMCVCDDVCNVKMMSSSLLTFDPYRGSPSCHCLQGIFDLDQLARWAGRERV